MILKTFNVTLDVLVVFSVWCAALLVTVVALHLLVVGGLTAYYLLHC